MAGSYNEPKTEFTSDPEKIFVFGSNLAGRHGLGAALYARRYKGAKYGVGQGRTGNSYALPTKDANLKTLPIWLIKSYVAEFLDYARQNPDLKFELTRVGCGLAGYKDHEMAPLFKGVTSNVTVPKEWVPYIQEKP